MFKVLRLFAIAACVALVCSGIAHSAEKCVSTCAAPSSSEQCSLCCTDHRTCTTCCTNFSGTQRQLCESYCDAHFGVSQP